MAMELRPAPLSFAVFVTGGEFLVWDREAIARLREYRVYADDTVPTRLSHAQVSEMRRLADVSVRMVDGDDFRAIRAARFGTADIEVQRTLDRAHRADELRDQALSFGIGVAKRPRRDMSALPADSSMMIAETVAPWCAQSLVATTTTAIVDTIIDDVIGAIIDTTCRERERAGLVTMSASNYGSDISLYDSDPRQCHSRAIVHFGPLSVMSLVSKARVAHHAHKVLVLADDDRGGDDAGDARCVSIEWESSLSNAG